MTDESQPDEYPSVGNQGPPTSPTEWTENQLPPVKPPTAGLLVQLFFVPMVIVTIIVSIWLMFGWLALSGAKPEELAADLESLNAGSWQKALELSQMLRNPRNAELRQDKSLAERLATMLDSQLDQQSESGSEQELLKIWLCRALCQFDIDTGLTALIKASSSAQNLQVRRAAVQGIGLLADRITSDIVSYPSLIPALQDAATAGIELMGEADEKDYGQLRASTAFTLGIVGGPQAQDTLTAMLVDPYPNARYNAATGLARHGDVRAVPRLREMIKLDNEMAVRYEEESTTEKAWKQNLVIMNGLRAIGQLYAINSDAVDQELRTSVSALKSSAKLRGAAAVELTKVLNALEQHD